MPQPGTVRFFDPNSEDIFFYYTLYRKNFQESNYKFNEFVFFSINFIVIIDSNRIFNTTMILSMSPRSYEYTSEFCK